MSREHAPRHHVPALRSGTRLPCRQDQRQPPPKKVQYQFRPLRFAVSSEPTIFRLDRDSILRGVIGIRVLCQDRHVCRLVQAILQEWNDRRQKRHLVQWFMDRQAKRVSFHDKVFMDSMSTELIVYSVCEWLSLSVADTTAPRPCDISERHADSHSERQDIGTCMNEYTFPLHFSSIALLWDTESLATSLTNPLEKISSKVRAYILPRQDRSCGPKYSCSSACAFHLQCQCQTWLRSTTPMVPRPLCGMLQNQMHQRLHLVRTSLPSSPVPPMQAAGRLITSSDRSYQRSMSCGL